MRSIFYIMYQYLYMYPHIFMSEFLSCLMMPWNMLSYVASYEKYKGNSEWSDWGNLEGKSGGIF